MARVLLIEDECSIAHNICELLEMEGHETRHIDNGKYAIPEVLVFEPDAIVCDILMPEVDGFETYQMLQGDSRTRPIPFMFLSAAAERPVIHRIRLLNIPYMAKPFDIDKFLDKVREMCDRRAAAIAN